MSTTDEREFEEAVTEILTIFDDDPQMTEELLAIEDSQHTAESHALVRIREIGRRVMEVRRTSADTTEAHVREAERLIADRDPHAPDEPAWQGLTAAAQVHATLAQVATATEMMPWMEAMAKWVTAGQPDVPASSERAATS